MIKSKILLASLLLMLAGACQSPFLIFPGKEIRGEVSAADNFSFAKDFSILKLETRPRNPYSIFLRVTLIKDQLYIDAAPTRRWHDYIQNDHRVRIQLGEFIYPARAIVVEDPNIKAHFIKSRTIYRIVPN